MPKKTPKMSKSNLTSSLLRALSLASTLIIVLAGSADAVSLSLSPASATLSPGDSIALTLLASDPAPAVIGDYDIDLGYDPSVISVVGFEATSVLGDFLLGQAFDFSFGDVVPGLLNITVVSSLDASELSPLQLGTFALATFTLALGPVPPPGGLTQISLSVNALGDGDGLPLAVDSLDGATLTVIPEPTTVCLIGMGLALLAFRRPPLQQRV